MLKFSHHRYDLSSTAFPLLLKYKKGLTLINGPTNDVFRAKEKCYIIKRTSLIMTKEIWKFLPSDKTSQCEQTVYSELISELYATSCWYGRLSQEEVDYYRGYIQDAITLEMGCGTGRLLVPLFQAGCNIYGMDISNPMLKKLKSLLPPKDRHRVVQWSTLETPYPVDDEIFERVIIPFSSFGLMHEGSIEDLDDNKVFREFFRILRPGGLVILNDARGYVYDKSCHNIASIVQQEYDGKQYKNVKAQIKDNNLFLTFKHHHPKHGNIKEERISTFSLKKTRTIPALVIRERETVFIRLRDNQVLERKHEIIPVLDAEDYPVLGKNAGFEHLKTETTPRFHIYATVSHIFRKP